MKVMLVQVTRDLTKDITPSVYLDELLNLPECGNELFVVFDEIDKYRAVKMAMPKKELEEALNNNGVDLEDLQKTARPNNKDEWQDLAKRNNVDPEGTLKQIKKRLKLKNIPKSKYEQMIDLAKENNVEMRLKAVKSLKVMSTADFLKKD